MLAGFHKTVSQNTLYCSFCGKSQHEVKKLIAGSTVFICDECVILCDDIIWDALEDRCVIKARIPSGSELDDALFEVISRLMHEKFPDLEFRYECKTQEPGFYPKETGVSFALYSFSRDAVEERGEKKVSNELTHIVQELAVTKVKFLAESNRRKKIENELNKLKSEYLDHLRKNYFNTGLEETELVVVMFLDVSGFSKFASDEKGRVVDTIRGLALPILGSTDANRINMWGDAIVAVFSDVNQSIECAIKFQRHLAVEQLDIRIGMAWGEVRHKYNEVLDRRDIDGRTVDYAARLESFADVGQIILSEEFGGLDIINSRVSLTPVTIEVKKEFADKKIGDKLNVFRLDSKLN